MKQEIVTPCALIVVGAAVCFYGLWDFWTTDLTELFVTFSFGSLVAALGVCELIWTNQFNETCESE